MEALDDRSHDGLQKSSLSLFVGLLVGSLLGAPATLADSLTEERVAKRSGETEIVKSIMGALIYLDDTQTRYGRTEVDCDLHNPDLNDLGLNRHACSLPTIIDPEKTPNLVINYQPLGYTHSYTYLGDWASRVSFMPGTIIGSLGEPIRDSNLFTTASVVFPLFLLDDSQLDPKDQIISQMKDLALKNIESFKRESAYSFWPLFQNRTDHLGRSYKVNGPINIDLRLMTPMAELADRSITKPFRDLLFGAFPSFFLEWIVLVRERDTNPTGIDAFFSIPNDADDTSLAIAANHFYLINEGL